MRFFTKTVFTLMIALLAFQVNAQKRYLDPVFDDVQVSGLDFAGTNFTVLGWIFAAAGGQQGNTIRQPLAFQTYMPEGDTADDRPLVIYLHTGNFFPFPQNGSCGGTIADSTNVEIATRLAKMGYVVASADYRLGWLPTHPEELVRRFSLINGAYRGVQDVNTFIRYFKRSVEEGGNPFGIDPNKIVVWGQGTGGYLSLASAYLNEYNEIVNTSDPSKFILPTPAGPVPMVLEPYNGNIDGTNDPTFVDATYNALSQLPLGDTLSVPNHVGYDSEFQLAVNMGGALGDSTWVSEGEVPLVSFHTVPIGSARGEDFSGLMSFTGTPNNTSAPWEWTDVNNPALIATDCNADGNVGRTYIDSIIGFYAPRGCVALNLDCFSTSTTDLELDGSYLTIAPNPAQSFITISSDKSEIIGYEIYSVDGRVVSAKQGLATDAVTVQRADMPSGIYFVKARFEEGVSTQRIVFD